jgi:murein DD-endopeptidase MepM/ murein hydrolase activator NlpD
MKTNLQKVFVPATFSPSTHHAVPCVALAAIGLVTLLFVASEPATAAAPASFAWVKTFDAPRGAVTAGIAADNAGNAYIAGHFWGRVVIGNAKLASEGGADIFVAKMNPDGEFLWVAHKGTSDDEIAHGIGVEASGSIYSYGELRATSASSRAYFLLKHDPSGTQVWTKEATESMTLVREGESPRHLFAVDGKGDCFLVAPGRIPRVVCYGPDGAQRWSTPLGDRWDEARYGVMGLAGRKSGGAVVTGMMRDTLKLGSKTLTPANKVDFFVVSLDAAGSIQWVEQSESREVAWPNALAVDEEDSVFVLADIQAETRFGDKTAEKGNGVFVKYDRYGKVAWAVKGGPDMVGVFPEEFQVNPSGEIVIRGDVLDSVSKFGSSSLKLNAVRCSFVGSIDRFAKPLWALLCTDNESSDYHPHSMAVNSRGDVFLACAQLYEYGSKQRPFLIKVEVGVVGGRLSPEAPAAKPAPQPSKGEAVGGLAPWSLAILRPNGNLGEFRHGTKCVGFYEAAQPEGKLTLVDIQVAGKASSKSYTKTKSLVHAGLDIVGPEGSEIRPAADGTVDDVIVSPNDENFGSLGYMVIVEHAQKFVGKPVYSVYLHMKDKPKVAVGQSVKAGQTVLGLVGSTGAAFGPHVHFELRRFSGRFFPKWKNIYGIERPKEEATFDESDFAANWLDPEKAAATVSVLPHSESAGQGRLPSAEVRVAERTETWTWASAPGGAGVNEFSLNLRYNGDTVTGTLSGRGGQRVVELSEGKLNGDQLSFRVNRAKYSGVITGDTIKGKIEIEVNGQLRSREWEANKKPGSESPAAAPPSRSSGASPTGEGGEERDAATTAAVSQPGQEDGTKPQATAMAPAKSEPKSTDKPTFQELTAGIKDGDQFQTYSQDFAYPYDRVWDAAFARITRYYRAGEYDADREQGTILTKSKKFMSDGSFDGYLHSRYAVVLEKLTDTSTRLTIKRWTYAETKPGEIHVINSWMLSGGSKGVLKDIGKAAEKAGKGK